MWILAFPGLVLRAVRTIDPVLCHSELRERVFIEKTSTRKNTAMVASFLCRERERERERERNRERETESVLRSS